MSDLFFRLPCTWPLVRGGPRAPPFALRRQIAPNLLSMLGLPGGLPLVWITSSESWLNTASAKNTPSVGEALSAYAARLTQIRGGTPATVKSLEAWTWQPALVPAAREAIIDALESLVNQAGGNEPRPRRSLAAERGCHGNALPWVGSCLKSSPLSFIASAWQNVSSKRVLPMCIRCRLLDRSLQSG